LPSVDAPVMIRSVTSDIATLLADAKPYRPTAVVTARKLARPTMWQSDRGATLRAAVGDWELRDGEETSWTIAPATFERSYRRRADGRYEKHELVEAVRLTDHVQVPTREGLSAASPGDWLLRDSSGATWPITDRLFHARYQPA
jgi:hypothetical protein